MERRLYARNRIKELRKAQGLSLERLIDRMGDENLTSSTLSKLENRQMGLTLDYLGAIASALGVSEMEIIGSDPVAGARILPVAGRISAGNWQDAVAMSDVTAAVPGHLRGLNLFVLRPEGDSMNKLVQEDGYIVVDPDQRDLIDKKYYALMDAEGRTTFKQFCSNPLQLLPCSTNPDHRPIPLGSEPFLVIGRVIHVGQDL